MPPDVPDVWTPDAIMTRLNGDVMLVRELVAMFVQDHGRQMEALRASVAAGDPEAIRRAAHALKGCVANFTTGGPHRSAYDIERLGQGGPLAEIPPALARLESEIDDMVIRMRAFLGASCAS